MTSNRMYFLKKGGDDALNLTSGVFACEAGTVRNPLTHYETIHVIEGEVRQLAWGRCPAGQHLSGVVGLNACA